MNNRQYQQWLKDAAAHIITTGLFYLLFAYVGRFSTRQSIVLALVVAALVLAHDRFALKHSWTLSPYWVSANPKWPQLLMDFKLISNQEEWDVIEESFKELPFTEHRVLRSGVNFTVVRCSQDYERTLLYSNDHRSFFTEYDIVETLYSAKPEGNRYTPFLGGDHIWFFMRICAAGYNLGIIVPEEWWKSVRQTCPVPLEEESYYERHVRLVLATVSAREFDLYYGPLKPNFEWMDRITARRNEERSKYGWKKIDFEESYFPETIEHRYFRVEHQGV